MFMWPHTDYSIVMRDTTGYYFDDHCRVIDVDLGSAGEPIVEQYQAMGLRVEGVSFTLGNKDEMVTYLRSLRQRAAQKVPPYLALPRRGAFVDELRAQMKEQERILGTGQYPRYDHPQNRHDDLFWALNLACAAARPFLTVGSVWQRLPERERFIQQPDYLK